MFVYQKCDIIIKELNMNSKSQPNSLVSGQGPHGSNSSSSKEEELAQQKLMEYIDIMTINDLESFKQYVAKMDHLLPNYDVVSGDDNHFNLIEMVVNYAKLPFL